MVVDRSKYGKKYILPFKYSYPHEKGKWLTRFKCVYTVRCKAADFLRTVTAASDLVDCTLVNCVCMRVEGKKCNKNAYELLKSDFVTS